MYRKGGAESESESESESGLWEREASSVCRRRGPFYLIMAPISV